MPRQRSNQQQSSAPPSPVCSDTVSLPDATSDLDNLSDYSGLSVSDEDDKHSRSNTESDVEQFSDGDFDEITHSMLGSSDLRSPALTRVKDQATSTSTSDNVDPEKTPSASFNRGQRPSCLFNKRISASDLAYPTLSQSTDTDNIFGLNLNSIYQQFEEERTISQDQDLIGYSILDTQGESFRRKYERSVQTELADSAINDSADTLSGLIHSATVDSTGDDTDNPFVSGGWPKEADTRPKRDQNEDKKLLPRDEQEEGGDETSLLANWQRCGPRWLNKQTFGIFGVVLLGVAAYHVKTAPWLSIDTSGLFLNTSSVIISDSSTTFIVTTTDLPLHKAAAATIPPVDTGKVAASPSSTAQFTSSVSRTSESEQSSSDVSSAYNKAALSSIPSSVSALISLASSSIASLSTHVASAPNPGDCSKNHRFQAIVNSRQKGHRCSIKTPGKVENNLPPSEIRPAGLLPYGAAALSGLPRKAQRGLSTLTQRASPPSIVRHDTSRYVKYEKKKQVSRRTGKHWIKPLVQEPLSKPATEFFGDDALSKQAAQHLAPGKAVQAPFSRLNAHKFWNVVPYMQAGRSKTSSSFTFPKVNAPVSDEEQQLFLDTASALSSFSFGSLCKQLDDVLLPFAQQIVDSLSTLDYAAVLQWLRSTANECYGIMAPYMTRVDAYAKKHVTEWSEEVKKVASVSIVQADGIYSDATAYLQHLQVAYKVVVYQYKVRAQKKVQEATKLAERVSKASAKKIYARSKATVGKANKNARKLSRRPVAFSRQFHKKYHNNPRDSKLRK